MYAEQKEEKDEGKKKTFALFHVFNHKSNPTSTKDGSEVIQK